MRKILAFFLIIILNGCLGEIQGSNDLSHLDIKYILGPAKMTLGSDLGNSNLAPRIDAYTGETYFWLRLDHNIYQNYNFFLESFQGSDFIVKSRDWPILPYIWGGTWLRPGIKYQDYSWSIEGGPVYYGFSQTQPSHWGALIEWKLEF